MKVLSLILLIISLCIPTFANADITTTFDKYLEEWEAVGAYSLHRDVGGNPDGHMDIHDIGPQLNYLVAPDTYYGDKSSYNGGILSFDVRLTSPSNYSDFRYGTVEIRGETGGVAWIDLIDTPSASWATYTTSLTSTAWNVTAGNWTDILSNVTEISIVLDEGTRGNSSGFDNFAIKATVVPEPISYILFLAGGAALGFRRYTKKKSIN